MNYLLKNGHIIIIKFLGLFSVFIRNTSALFGWCCFVLGQHVFPVLVGFVS